MNERVYRVLVDDDIYWVEDASTIYSSFGRVVEVVQFDLCNPLDITDQMNGDYFDQ